MVATLAPTFFVLLIVNYQVMFGSIPGDWNNGRLQVSGIIEWMEAPLQNDSSS